MSVTHRQRDCLDFIIKYQRENRGVSPTFDEIRVALGLASKGGVYRLVTELEERGMLTRHRGLARALTIQDVGPLPPPFIEKQDIGCAGCVYAFTMEQTKYAHRMGCNHPETVKKCGGPSPIITARHPKAPCGSGASLFKKREGAAA